MELSACFIPTRFGTALLGWRNAIELFVLPQRAEERLLSHLLRLGYRPGDIRERVPPFPGIEAIIQAYFDGIPVTFPYPYTLEHLPTFTKRVLEVVAQIPYGTTQTYGDIAKKIALPRATRAVGRALGKNPLPLLIPCHRVTGASQLGGFSGYGLRYKILLLSIELSRDSLGRNGSL